MASAPPLAADRDLTRRNPAPRSPATRSERPLRVLVFTSLFPSVVRPRHGIFVETRLSQLIKDCSVDAKVVAPVPWFPSASPRFGSYALFAATPRSATRPNGVEVTYPRYPMLPRVGVAWQPDAMARCALRDIEQLRQSGWQPDLIDAHYLYPDGVAAAWLARRLHVPFVMTARGTDVNVLAALAGPGKRIAEAAQQAHALITVSQPLKAKLIELGIDAGKVTVLRNGVDLDAFGLEDRASARARLQLPADGRLLLCVGNLLPEKGQALALECLARLPAHHRLLIVGDGPLRGSLAALAEQLGLASRVMFRSALPQRELRYVYAAADALLLTSTREGWPNVVLEAIACGTPVVACEVGAVRDMIIHPHMGCIAGRDVAAFTAAIEAALADGAPPAQVRQHAARFDWASISQGQYELFRRAAGRLPGDSRRETPRADGDAA